VDIISKESYTLKKVENNTYHLFNLIKRDIPSSIFSLLDFKFFNQIIKEKIIHLYVIRYKKKISAIFTLATVKNLQKLKYKIFFYFFFNPHKFIYNLKKLISSLSRNSNISFNNSYMYLLHLIIYKKKFLNISRKKKDKIINFFLKKILIIFKKKNIYACFERKNLRALKFYFRNKFTVYSKNKNSFFVKKKFIRQ